MVGTNYSTEQIIKILDEVKPYAAQAARIVEDIAKDKDGITKKEAAIYILRGLLLLANIKYSITPEVKLTIEKAFGLIIDSIVFLYNQIGVFIKGNKPEVKAA